MIAYDGHEIEDENGNQQPEIYSLIQSTNNSEPFHRQINRFGAMVRSRGFESVDRSAYLRYHICTYSSLFKRHIDKIKRHLSTCTELPRGPNDYDMVFVWNIGDITMLTRDHFEELKMLRPDIKPALHKLRERICEGVNGLEDSMNIIRKVDNIEDALAGETDEMRRAAPMYDALKQLYDSAQSDNRDEKKPNINQELLEKLGVLGQEHELRRIVKKHQKVYYNRWKYAKRCMELVNRRSAKSETRKYANVVMCEEGVASAISQLILAGFSSSIIPIENVYSMYPLPGETMRPYVVFGNPKRSARTYPVIERIRRRFGTNCALVNVSSDLSFLIGRRMLQWRVAANESIKTLYDLQRDIL